MGKCILAMVAACGLAGAAGATTIVREVAIANASFEAQLLGDGSYTNNDITGWHVGGGTNTAGAQNPLPSALPRAPDGRNVAYLNTFQLWNGYTTQGSLWQTLGEQAEAGTRYTLSAQIGRRLDVASLPDFVAELLVDGQAVASGTLFNADVAHGTFATLAFDYLATPAAKGALGIRFTSRYNPVQGKETWQATIDDVRLTAAPGVPEPASWAMMVVGLGLAGAALRRQRAAQAMG